MGINKVKAPAVFLDRDGVINQSVVRGGKPYPPANPTELKILPGVPLALKRLKQAGYRLVVVTNQPDVSRGKQKQEIVEHIHTQLRHSLPLDDIKVCYHDDADGCDCRKPRPGMLLAAAREMNIDLTQSFMVGDRWRDIEAGHQAGCQTIFIDYHYAETEPKQPHARVKTLLQAADWILAQQRGGMNP